MQHRIASVKRKAAQNSGIPSTGERQGCLGIFVLSAACLLRLISLPLLPHYQRGPVEPAIIPEDEQCWLASRAIMWVRISKFFWLTLKGCEGFHPLGTVFKIIKSIYMGLLHVDSHGTCSFFGCDMQGCACAHTQLLHLDSPA